MLRRKKDGQQMPSFQGIELRSVSPLPALTALSVKSRSSPVIVETHDVLLSIECDTF
jgi:hypothetical protein